MGAHRMSEIIKNHSDHVRGEFVVIVSSLS